MSSPHTNPIQTISNYERGIYAACDYVNKEVDYDKTVVRLQRLGSRALTVLGEVHLQESANNPDKSATCISNAEAAFSERIFSFELGLDPRAAIRLAQLPLYTSLVVDRRLPDSDVLAESYQSVLWAADTAANHFAYRDGQTSKDGLELLGTLSEVTVLSILTRQALKSKKACLPVQTLLSESLRAEDNSRGWDINVHMFNRNGQLEIRDKIQVMNSDRFMKKYSRGIAVVAINPDLAIDRETNIDCLGILSDLKKEGNPFEASSRASKRLNYRTDKLLALIKRAK